MIGYIRPVLLLLLLPGATELRSQTVYSQWANPSGHYSTTRTPNFLCTPLNCPTISNADRAVDNDLTNFATINFPLLNLAASASITMDLSTTVDATHWGGVMIQSATSLLGLEVLPSITVELLNNSTVVGSRTFSSLIDLSLMEQEEVRLCDAASGPYNKVRLTINSPLGIGASLSFQVYYAYAAPGVNCVNGILGMAHTGEHPMRQRARTDSIQLQEIRLYPTIARSMVQLTLPQGREPRRITVSNTMGQIFHPRLERTSQGYRIYTDKLQPGLYVMRLDDETGTTARKFLVLAP